MSDEEWLKATYGMVLASWKDFKTQAERILKANDSEKLWDEYVDSVSERGSSSKSHFQRQLDSVFLCELERRVVSKNDSRL